MNEVETRAEHIDPALKAVGWGVVEAKRRDLPCTEGLAQAKQCAVANDRRERFAAVPFEDKGGMWGSRYYQDSAVNNVLGAIADKQQRILLTLPPVPALPLIELPMEQPAIPPSKRKTVAKWLLISQQKARQVAAYVGAVS